MSSDFSGEFGSGFDVDTGNEIGADVSTEGFDSSSFDLSPIDSSDISDSGGSFESDISSDFNLEPLEDGSSYRGMDFETRFEKEPMNEPEFVGEFAPSIPASDIESWESLKEVPFAGDTSEISDVSDTDWSDLQDVPFAGDDSFDASDITE
jgi:hypothetical protein